MPAGLDLDESFDDVMDAADDMAAGGVSQWDRIGGGSATPLKVEEQVVGVSGTDPLPSSPRRANTGAKAHAETLDAGRSARHARRQGSGDEVRQGQSAKKEDAQAMPQRKHQPRAAAGAGMWPGAPDGTSVGSRGATAGGEEGRAAARDDVAGETAAAAAVVTRETSAGSKVLEAEGAVAAGGNAAADSQGMQEQALRSQSAGAVYATHDASATVKGPRKGDMVAQRERERKAAQHRRKEAAMQERREAAAIAERRRKAEELQRQQQEEREIREEQEREMAALKRLQEEEQARQRKEEEARAAQERVKAEEQVKQEENSRREEATRRAADEQRHKAEQQAEDALQECAPKPTHADGEHARKAQQSPQPPPSVPSTQPHAASTATPLAATTQPSLQPPLPAEEASAAVPRQRADDRADARARASSAGAVQQESLVPTPPTPTPPAPTPSLAPAAKDVGVLWVERVQEPASEFGVRCRRMGMEALDECRRGLEVVRR